MAKRFEINDECINDPDFNLEKAVKDYSQYQYVSCTGESLIKTGFYESFCKSHSLDTIKECSDQYYSDLKLAQDKTRLMPAFTKVLDDKKNILKTKYSLKLKRNGAFIQKDIDLTGYAGYEKDEVIENLKKIKFSSKYIEPFFQFTESGLTFLIRFDLSIKGRDELREFINEKTNIDVINSLDSKTLPRSRTKKWLDLKKSIITFIADQIDSAEAEYQATMFVEEFNKFFQIESRYSSIIMGGEYPVRSYLLLLEYHCSSVMYNLKLDASEGLFGLPNYGHKYIDFIEHYNEILSLLSTKHLEQHPECSLPEYGLLTMEEGMIKNYQPYKGRKRDETEEKLLRQGLSVKTVITIPQLKLEGSFWSLDKITDGDLSEFLERQNADNIRNAG